MDIGILIRLQLSMYLLVAVGIFLSRIKFISEDNERFLSNLLIQFILPCNIVKSFLIEFNIQVLRQFAVVLGIACLATAVQLLLGWAAFRPFRQEGLRKVMQYGLINANSAFIALPIIEGMFGSAGLAHASVYMIPVRVSIWTVGLSIFSSQEARGRQLVKRCVLHPCMVALYIGMFLMLAQLQLPSFLVDSLQFSSSCMTALSMLLIGAILSRIPLREGLKPAVFYFCLMRLIVLPGIIFAACTLLGTDDLTRGVCVVMTAMPAASLTAVLAKQYHADAESAGYIVIVSTLLNTLTLPLWGMMLNAF